MRKAAILLILISMTAILGKGIHWAKKGFTLRRIALPIDAELEIWNHEADLALSQPYRYLGRGRQCFAFESLDGKYVLKLPRTDIYHTPLWMRILPGFEKRREAVSLARAWRKNFILTSMRIAYDELFEETGVFALHFGRTPDRDKKITLIDPLGFSYQLPSHTTSFVLQTKQPILMKAFITALHKDDRLAAERILDAFIDVVVNRGKKGIWNKDESFLRNYGFDGKRGYQIDIGSFYHKGGAIASIRDTMHPVRTWLSTIDPDMLQYFDRKLEERLEP